MSVSKQRGKFRSDTPIAGRPEDRIAAQTAERRAAAAADRRRRLTRPSWLTVAIVIFALIGFGIAGYTTAVHYGGFNPACFGGGVQSSCTQVQGSIYNNVDGVPVSVLGLIGYFCILGSLLVRNEYARAAGFGVALIGFLFSLYLTYREAFSLHEYCEWCLGSAACMTLLTVLLGWRFFRAEPVVGRAVAAD